MRWRISWGTCAKARLKYHHYVIYQEKQENGYFFPQTRWKMYKREFEPEKQPRINIEVDKISLCLTALVNILKPEIYQMEYVH